MARTFSFSRRGIIINLRTKLIAVLLIVTLLSIMIVALLVNRQASATLTEDAGANVRRVAETQASEIGALLTTQLVQLQYLTLNETLQQDVLASNSTILSQAEIETLDQQWQAAVDNAPLIHDRLNNALATELQNFTEVFLDQPELFVTDKRGALIASTNRTSDFYQADESWWQESYNDGQGAVYISVPEYDESSATLASIIAVPIYDPTSSEVIGVLRTTYDVSKIGAILLTTSLGQTGRSELYFPNNLEFEPDDREVEHTVFDPRALLSADLSEAVFLEDIHDDVPSMIGLAPVLVDLGGSSLVDLGWTVTVFQDREEALHLVNEQTRSTLFWIVLIGLGTVGVGFVAAQLLTGPIKRLTDVTQQIAAGDLSRRATVESQDEIGILAQAFNAMTDQLRENIENLASRVAERTDQLETVVEVSGRLTGILELDELTRQVVTLTKETFDYYHAHIYLLDDQGETLIMAEGYGPAGVEMKRQGHRIPLAAPQSLVARSAREGEVIIVADVHADPNWLPNPLLPNTHSEMAVPIMLEAKVVGVLDVQSDQVGGLTEADQATLQVLANQIAIAVRNANLFAQVRQQLEEAERLQRRYVGQAWQQLSAEQKQTYFEARQATATGGEVPEVDVVLQQKRTVDLKVPPTAVETNGHGNGHRPGKARRVLATPLQLHNQIIGVLGLEDENPDRQWTEDEIALIEAVSEQMSLAIENARLVQETGRRATREKVIADLTQKVWASDEIDQVMRVAVEQLGATLNASKVVIKLGTEDQLGSLK